MLLLRDKHPQRVAPRFEARLQLDGAELERSKSVWTTMGGADVQRKEGRAEGTGGVEEGELEVAGPGDWATVQL